ncbi:unnamed protein product [Cylicocyclus nassatus]|uniref:SCP domain-containing protein n=1 Tax=Cylicocyclus nassatus TaxID=53992 RepID=A0AA36M704_CYLNA|nr:unnamed protein product [Cylicocyclus nassatus]
MDFYRDLSLLSETVPSKVRICAIAAIFLLTFFALGLPLLITPLSDLGEIDEDCGLALSEQSRRIFLQLHNKYRSRAAKGEYTIKNKWSKMKVLPPATRMLQFKYNCSLERSALKYAYIAQGKMIHSHWKGLGENLWAISVKITHERAAERATKSWGDEITNHGMGKLSDSNQKIGHATQILWHSTRSVGCGIIYAKSGWTSVVCHYYPQGNFLYTNMYRAGETLSDCGKEGRSEVPHSRTGLCELF